METHPTTFRPDHFTEDLVQMQDQLFYYALQLTEDRDNAQDLVQETSYKALKNRGKLHNHDHIRAWLYTILRNTHINYLRSSHYRQLVHDTDEISQLGPPENGENESNPENILAKKELHEILKKLPSSYEKPIFLFLTGHSYKEIAKQMNIPIGTVKSRIHLGKKRIRKLYAA